MSVTYFLNWMGPISKQWYTDRGLTRKVSKILEDDRAFYLKGLKDGDVLEYDEITVSYSAGRIDIRDSSKEGYEGWGEYAVPPMVSEDWYILGYWLATLDTTEVWDYEMLISIFEGEVLNGREIRWWKDED